VRRSLRTRKVGHAGTLDPMATGLLILGVGRATRLLRYLGDLSKSYTATGRLGEETDTLDADGQIVRSASVDVSRAEIEGACAALVGDSLQTPPAYSAVKVGGRKLYQAARKGDALEAPARRIRVDAFEVSAFDGRDVEVRIACSGGTYVRVLVRTPAPPAWGNRSPSNARSSTCRASTWMPRRHGRRPTGACWDPRRSTGPTRCSAPTVRSKASIGTLERAPGPRSCSRRIDKGMRARAMSATMP
jgi:tRNA pseudouridine(55) synthase